MLTWLQICWRAMLFVPSSICLGIFPVIIACWIGLCVVLCGVLCLVAIIQSISSGLLNPLFFDYNFFANRKILYQQIILPTIEVFYLCRAGGPLNAVTDRRLPGPRLTNPHPASSSHHVQSCPVQTQMHTQKQTPHQGPSVFAFVSSPQAPFPNSLYFKQFTLVIGWVRASKPIFSRPKLKVYC